LLQVCLQLLANCLHVLTERGGRILTISTQSHDGICVLQIATEKLPNTAAGSQDAENNLALSACRGILQEHRGQLCRESSADGSVHLRVELPAADAVPAKPKESTVPVMWQSQPYA
jgi:hypothetical protein